MKLSLALTLLVAVNLASSYKHPYVEYVLGEWESFKAEHGKTYASDEEEKFRMKVFMHNMNIINKHNRKDQKTFSMAMNQFGDLLGHEFTQMMNGFNFEKYLASDTYGATFLAPHHVDLPDHLDWREHGYVTEVKDQGQCGSCWAFSATGSLEGQHFRKSKNLTSLSEQNLIDCSVSFGNDGCDGGLMERAFEYIKKNDGIDTESSYPYQAADGQCHYKKSDRGADDTGFVDIPGGNVDALLKAVATIGPISVAIDASHTSFQFYSHGVYFEPECSPMNLDHGVLVVGYGHDEESNQDYWLVKNSWAATWGDRGYIKMMRDPSNMCGVASAATYPLV